MNWSDVSVSFCRQFFRGNYNIYNTVVHKLTPAIKARFVRIHPRTWRSYIAMRIELYGCRARGLYIFFTTGRGLSVLKRFRETFGAFKLLRLVKKINLHLRLIVVFVLKTRVNPRINACLRTSLFWYRLKGLNNVVLYERETNAVWARGWR